MIGRGRLGSGRTIREIDLVRKFGISRTPVREALHRLHAEGVITPHARGGYAVVQMSESEIAELYNVNGVLEGLAARLAAQHRNRSDVTRLDEIVREMDEAVERGDDARLIRANEAFHHAIAEAGRSSYLRNLLETIAETLDRYRSTAIEQAGRREPGHREHHAIAAAIAAEDADGAEKLAREHMERALAARLNHLRRSLTPRSRTTGTG
ncbi:MAG: GntR family transcriptional regulator [Candidatus Velthaea sp.]